MMKIFNSLTSIIAATGVWGIKARNIIRALQITSVVAVILAGIVFVSTIRQRAHGDERIERLLSSPDIIERFKKMERDRAKATQDQASPLVQQAEAFALHLNRKPETQKSVLAHKIEHTPPRIPLIQPNFKFLATSFCEGNPEISLALIDEPGKGRHWFKQSSKVSDFLITQIKDGLILVKSSEKTFMLTLEQGSETSLLRGMSAVSARTVAPIHWQSGLSNSGKTADGATKTMGEISVPTKYSVLEPMWGEGGWNGGLLSHASSVE